MRKEDVDQFAIAGGIVVAVYACVRLVLHAAGVAPIPDVWREVGLAGGLRAMQPAPTAITMVLSLLVMVGPIAIGMYFHHVWGGRHRWEPLVAGSRDVSFADVARRLEQIGFRLVDGRFERTTGIVFRRTENILARVGTAGVDLRFEYTEPVVLDTGETLRARAVVIAGWMLLAGAALVLLAPYIRVW